MSGRKLGIIGTALALGLVAPLMVQHRSLAILQEGNAELRRQLEALAANPREPNSSDSSQSLDGLTAEQRSELLRLRGQAALQKREIAVLQAGIGSGQAQVVSSASSQWLATLSQQQYLPKEWWATAGYETPEATLQSILWAASRNDVRTVLAGMTPEYRKLGEKQLEGKSENEVVSLYAKEAAQLEQVKGLRILSREDVSNDEVVLHVYREGVDNWNTIRLKRLDNEWKLASPF